MNEVLMLRMILEKCILRVKVLRLFVVIGVFSTVAMFLIYSLPNSENDQPTKFNQGLFSSWPKSSNIESHGNRKGNAFVVDISKHHTLTISGKGHGNNEHILRNKIKRSKPNILQSDDSMLRINSSKNLPKHSAPNIHIFYTIPVEWSQRATPFWPLLGTYVSDNQTLRHHLKNIQLIGTNVLVVTWSPSIQGKLLWHLFDEAANFGIHIAIEIDNYPNRTVSTIFNDIKYFYKEFCEHQSLYKVFVNSKSSYMPMFYFRNVESLTINDWKKLLLPDGELSLRSAFHDAVFVGHIK